MLPGPGYNATGSSSHSHLHRHQDDPNLKPHTRGRKSFEKEDTAMENGGGGGRGDVPEDANERKRSLLFSFY